VNICVDANTCAAAVLPGPHTSAAKSLLKRWGEAGVSLIAPDLWAYEVTSVVRKYIRAGRLSVQRGQAAMDAFFALGVLLMRPPEVHRRALELANRYDLGAAYDAHYLALADAEQVPFWTADERLYKRVVQDLPWVHWIGEVQPAI